MVAINAAVNPIVFSFLVSLILHPSFAQCPKIAPMKKMIAILMILIPLAALSQAKKSDAFYYKVVLVVIAKNTS